jgi:hypothetical protein
MLALVLPVAARAQSDLYEGEPIRYLTATATDPIARLQAALDQGSKTLTRDGRLGYLKSVLDALDIDPESQVLVFSKTSFQRDRIGPETPRALYFNDDVYVGHVRGGDVLELSAADPSLGGVFYLLDQRETEKPVFERATHDCLQCHASANTRGVPGHLVRSVFPLPSGQPAYNAGTFLTTDESPMNERWGGWYVTGTHGKQRHMGNALVTDRKAPERLDTETGANLTDLSSRFDASVYLRPTSDIVALLVLEHQTQMHNLIAAASYQARLARHYDEGINKALGRPADFVSISTEARLRGPTEKLVRGLLFSGATTFTDPVAGTSKFAANFTARGRKDARGRSLREFDLNHRLFRYPCSYLIESDAFAALPESIKGRTLRRLHEVLTATDPGPDFAHLTADDRRAIVEILTATVPGFPPPPAPASPPSSGSNQAEQEQE